MFFFPICKIQINHENELYKAGKADFYEKLNENSDLPKDVFEKEKLGAKNLKDSKGRGLGAVLPDESEWYTHPVYWRNFTCQGKVPQLPMMPQQKVVFQTSTKKNMIRNSADFKLALLLIF
jgi:hypothetical protein